MGAGVAIEFSYGDVEDVLVALNRIAPTKRAAFRARLKHLQRLKFPAGANSGTGKPAVYTFKMLLQMCLATELAQTGMSPKRIKKTIEGAWPDLEYSFFLCMFSKTDDLIPEVEDKRFVWVVNPEAMRDLSVDDEGDDDYRLASQAVPLSNLATSIEPIDDQVSQSSSERWIGEAHRHIVIQLQPLMLIVLALAFAVRSDLNSSDLAAEFDEQLEERMAAFDRQVEQEEALAARIAADPGAFDRLIERLKRGGEIGHHQEA